MRVEQAEKCLNRRFGGITSTPDNVITIYGQIKRLSAVYC